MPYWEAMQDKLVDVYEAARLLEMGRPAVDRLVKRGVLRTTMQGARHFFRLVDLEAFIEVRKRGTDPEAAFFEARQAAMETRAMRKELDNLKFVLGIDTLGLGTDRDSVVSLLLKTEDALRGPPILEHEELLTWAKNLYSLSESHLEAITFHTDQKQPWRAFLALGRKLCSYEDMRSTRDDPELYTTYRLLNAALRHARQVAYFHIRGLYGKAYAARLLPEVKGCPHENVIALAFNTQP
jgi:hypothetical protein